MKAKNNRMNFNEKFFTAGEKIKFTSTVYRSKIENVGCGNDMSEKDLEIVSGWRRSKCHQ